MLLTLIIVAIVAYALYYLLFRPKGFPSGPNPPIIGTEIPWIGCGLQFVLGMKLFNSYISR